MKTATALGLFIALVLSLSARAAEPAPAGRTVHHSTDFGWTADQDVTEAFTKLLTDGTLKAGDELVLDHTYRINVADRNHRALPANFTLSAVRGAGFAMFGAKTEGASNFPMLELGDRNTLRNLTLTCLDVPTVKRFKVQAAFFTDIAVYADGKDDILIENCRIDGPTNHNVKLQSCRRAKLIGCHFSGAWWSVYMVDVTDTVVWRCLFEKYLIDGIKTGLKPGTQCSGFLIEDCVFQDNLKPGDGIDTTGGFGNSIVRNTIFRRLQVSGMDIKTIGGLRGGEPTCPPHGNSNIRVENCQFLDMPNAIVLTMIDDERRTKQPDMLTPENAKDYAPHDIDLVDCVIGHVETPPRTQNQGGYGVNYPDKNEHMRCILLKDAYNIRYKDLRLIGERIMPFIVDPMGLSGDYGIRFLSAEASKSFEHTVGGNILDEPAAPVAPGQTEPPFACGPR